MGPAHEALPALALYTQTNTFSKLSAVFGPACLLPSLLQVCHEVLLGLAPSCCFISHACCRVPGGCEQYWHHCGPGEFAVQTDKANSSWEEEQGDEAAFSGSSWSSQEHNCVIFPQAPDKAASLPGILGCHFSLPFCPLLCDLFIIAFCEEF